MTEDPRTLADRLEGALVALSAYTQNDMEGITCSVSRQAVVEIIDAADTILAALRPTPPSDYAELCRRLSEAESRAYAYAGEAKLQGNDWEKRWADALTEAARDNGKALAAIADLSRQLAERDAVQGDVFVKFEGTVLEAVHIARAFLPAQYKPPIDSLQALATQRKLAPEAEANARLIALLCSESARNEIIAALEERERLREALEPFANAARYLERETEDEVCDNLGAKHLIAARAALTGSSDHE